MNRQIIKELTNVKCSLNFFLKILIKTRMKNDILKISRLAKMKKIYNMDE